MNVLDLRPETVIEEAMKSNYRRDASWLAAWIAVAVIVVAGIGYGAYLEHGCKVDGYMTWHGKECIN